MLILAANYSGFAQWESETNEIDDLMKDFGPLISKYRNTIYKSIEIKSDSSTRGIVEEYAALQTYDNLYYSLSLLNQIVKLSETSPTFEAKLTTVILIERIAETIGIQLKVSEKDLRQYLLFTEDINFIVNDNKGYQIKAALLMLNRVKEIVNKLKIKSRNISDAYLSLPNK